jgi:hypothetical protein
MHRRAGKLPAQFIDLPLLIKQHLPQRFHFRTGRRCGRRRLLGRILACGKQPADAQGACNSAT